MPLSEYNWERFFQQQAESKENIVEKEANNKKKNVTLTRKKAFVVKIKPKEADKIALSLLKNIQFMKKLKSFVGSLIANKQNITRLDFAISTNSDKELLKLYGMTKDHFKDIANGNLTAFDLKPDGDDLAIYFKRASGEPAIRPIDDEKLAEILNIIFNALPELAPLDLKSDINVK